MPSQEAAPSDELSPAELQMLISVLQTSEDPEKLADAIELVSTPEGLAEVPQDILRAAVVR